MWEPKKKEEGGGGTWCMWRGDNYNENMLLMTATRARASEYSVSYKEWREIFLTLKTFFFFLVYVRYEISGENPICFPVWVDF